MMQREFTKREKVMLVILAVILLVVGYIKLVYEPIQEQIDNYRGMTDEVAVLADANAVKVAQMDLMQKKIDEIKGSGNYHALPVYDNDCAMKEELYDNLSGTLEYSLDFGELVQQDYVVCRPVSIHFTTDTYAGTRSVIDALAGSVNVCQLSDVDIQQSEDGTYAVYVYVSYFEVYE